MGQKARVVRRVHQKSRSEQDAESLGAIFARRRKEKGFTLRVLADKTGLSNALISQIETGRVQEPGFRTVVKIADALCVGIKNLADLARRR